MRKTLGLAVVLASLGGCATGTVDQSFTAMPGVSTERDAQGNQFVTSIEVSTPGVAAAPGDLAPCILQNVTNSSVTLTGTSAAFVSPFTGAVYRATGSDGVGGGQALQYVSETEDEAIATGVTDYQVTSMGMPVDKHLRYTLAVKSDGSGTKYHFGNLEQAQKDAGSAQNIGFAKLGAWSASQPEAARAALVRVADNISSCLSQR
ncbi:hypothetical protein [uncultured Halomonas sp.]|uniref:hypothetical protein n=1 Tax=uncultured Halomonas sp. TaxID=173971 RepID=UPI002593E7A1|nr:hypothetical protein [uncultured Halomonas sp.]